MRRLRRASHRFDQWVAHRVLTSYWRRGAWWMGTVFLSSWLWQLNGVWVGVLTVAVAFVGASAAIAWDIQLAEARDTPRPIEPAWSNLKALTIDWADNDVVKRARLDQLLSSYRDILTGQGVDVDNPEHIAAVHAGLVAALGIAAVHPISTSDAAAFLSVMLHDRAVAMDASADMP